MREMKDSGAKWIGAIPHNWSSDKLKYHLVRKEPKNPGEKIVLSLYREYGVIPKDSRDDNHNQTSEDTSKYKYVIPGNFVVNKMKAWQGSVAVSDYEGIISPAYYVYVLSTMFILRDMKMLYISIVPNAIPKQDYSFSKQVVLLILQWT